MSIPMKRLCALAFLAFLALPQRAHAGNDDALLLGNAAILSGGALTASVSDGSATWYNPAGLALVTRDSVDVSGSAYQLQFGSTPVLLESATGVSTPGNYTDFVVVPSALTMARRLAPDLVLGIGIFVPIMRAHDEQLALTENLPDGRADWSLVLRDNRQVYAVHLSLGVAITPTLRVGIGLFGNYDQDISSIHLFGIVTDPGGMITEGLAVSAYRWHRTLSLGLAAGVQWEPVPGLTLGVAIQSPQFSLGTLYTNAIGSLAASSSGIAGAPTIEGDLVPSFEIAAPARLRFGAALALGPALVSLDGDIQHELTNPAVGVDRRTTFGVRVGARVRIDESISLGGGLFSDFSADRGPYVYGRTRAQYLGASIGLEIRSRHRLGEGESAGTIDFIQTFGVRYAYGEGRIGALRFDLRGETGLSVIASPTSIHETALHIGSGVYF